MTNVAKILYDFWNSFGLPAFVENTVPDEIPDEHGNMHPVSPPYITYRLAKPDWNSPVSLYARVWFRSTSFDGLMAKVDEISQAIGTGKSIAYDGGYAVLNKDSIFSQYMNDGDDENTKVAYLSLIMDVVEAM